MSNCKYRNKDGICLKGVSSSGNCKLHCSYYDSHDLEIYAKTIEDEALEQINTLLSQDAFKDCKVRIMPERDVSLALLRISETK